MNIEYIKKIICSLWIFGLMVYVSSCDYPSNSVKKYSKGIIYPQKVDTLIAIPGINQVTFKVPKPGDPRVIEVGFFWNNNTDSLKSNFSPDKDTLKIKIDSLAVPAGKDSRLYTFDVYTFDKAGDKSVKVSKSVLIKGK